MDGGGGSTLLSDLPGGPPDNDGYNDNEVLNDIIDTVEKNTEGDGGGTDPNNGGRGCSDDDDDEDFSDLDQGYGQGNRTQNQNQYQNHQGGGQQFPPSSSVQQYMSSLHPPLPPRSRRYPSSLKKETPSPVEIAEFSLQIRDAIIIASLVYVSNTRPFLSFLDTIVPKFMRTVDDEYNRLPVSDKVKALVVGLIFYLIKIYLNPPNIVASFIHMYYNNTGTGTTLAAM